jgi:hypothetical protein
VVEQLAISQYIKGANDAKAKLETVTKTFEEQKKSEAMNKR